MKIEKEADLGGLSSMKVSDCLSLKWCLKRKGGVASSEQGKWLIAGKTGVHVISERMLKPA